MGKQAHTLNPRVRAVLLSAQSTEMTEQHIYRRLSFLVRDRSTKRILERIADDELSHYRFWKTYTGQDVAPSALKIFLYVWIARVFGVTFGVKLMEKGEQSAQAVYRTVVRDVPDAANILREEEEHEKRTLGLINEELLTYVGSIVLGLNDALVELIGALAGLTLAFQNTKFIAVAGLITGVAAAFSMAASAYLSVKTEGEKRKPLTSAVYTGVAYLATVVVLLTPYVLLRNLWACLALSLFLAVTIIATFSYYLSVVRDTPFRRRFVEMVALSFGVALLTFSIGLILRRTLRIEV